MQVLFAWDAAGAADGETARQVTTDGEPVDATTRLRATDWARGAWDYRKESDAWVERLAPQWPPRRQPAVDRSLLRLAVWELTSQPTPPKVVLDEAIELAKTFSTENSAAFVNGVLDQVLKEVEALKT